MQPGIAIRLGALLALTCGPTIASAQTDVPTTALFERHHVAPRSTAALRTTITGRTLSIKSLKTGAMESWYYGTQRIDANGKKFDYRIHDSGIEEERDGDLVLLLVYDWHGHSYICLANIGDSDVLGDAEGTCPYEIVGASEGNHLHGT
jgi:hypothetical protein